MSRDDELWNRILVRIAERTSAGCFDTWFRPVTSTGYEDKILHLSVPNESFRQSLSDNYADVLHEAVTDVAGHPWNAHSESICAAGPSLHAKMLAVIASV